MTNPSATTPTNHRSTTTSAALIAIYFVLAYILSSFPIMLLTLFITDIA